jgi:alpha-tubulin suppressor-like RCC1 family protein
MHLTSAAGARLTAAILVAFLCCAEIQLAGPSSASGRHHPGGPAGPAAASLYSWGNNSRGQLGNGSRLNAQTPGTVALPPGITPTAIAAGADFAFAAGLDGALYSWGDNLFGQLGNGSHGAMPGLTPVRVSFPAGVDPVGVAAGAESAYVIGSNGGLYGWGDNHSGQLGIDSVRSSYVPVRVKLPAGVTPTAVAAGESSAYVIGSDGSIYSWGSNSFGQLGDASFRNSAIPVRVALPAGMIPKAIAAGQSSAYALAGNGAIYAWGDNHSGQLGNVQAGVESPKPVAVQFPAGVTATAISSGSVTAYAIGSNGAGYAWGDNTYRQLGDGSTVARSTTPVRISLPSGVTPVAITGGRISAYAAGMAGDLYGWGNNSFGQLGNGATAGTSAPVRTSLPATATAAALAPEPMSTSGYSITGLAGIKTGSSIQEGRLTWFVDGPGPTIKIVGGGGGPDHSNCTSDTTNRSFNPTFDPTHGSFFIETVSSGSCAFQPSYSFFDITVTGRNNDGQMVNASGRIWLGQDGAGSPYYERCSIPLDHMTCRETGPHDMELVASP